VRCVACDSLQDPSADECGKCGCSFRELCACGAPHGLYDEGRCAVCGAAFVPPTSASLPRTFTRRAKAAALLAVAAFVVVVVAAPRPKPAWRLKAEARDHFGSGRYEAAAQLCRDATRQNPGDAEAWLMLAVCMRRLGFDVETQIGYARNALTIDTTRTDALCFLAEAEASRGRLEAALEYAEQATLVPLPPVRAFELIGEIEMRRPQPDHARAIAALERARADGDVDPRLTLQLAEARLAVYGSIPTDAIPPDVRSVLRDAETALGAMKRTTGDDAPSMMLRARLALALSRGDDALSAVDEVLRLIGADASVDARSQALVVRGRANRLRGDASAAARDFAEALRLTPDAPTAFGVSDAYERADDARTGEALLREALANSDPSGSIRAVLAGRLLSARRLDEAATMAVAARAAAPNDAFFAMIAGDVLAAQGQRDEAAAAYSDALRIAPGLRSARLRTAMLAIDAPGGSDARAAAIRAAVESVEAVRRDFAKDADVFDTLGILHTALGDVRAARDAFERAVALRPTDPALWVRFARTCRRLGDSESVERAEAAYGRARRLRPSDRTLVGEEVRTRVDAGDDEGAVEVCSQYLRDHPRDVSVLRLRAEAARRLARWDAAVADLELARKVASGEGGADEDAALVALVDTQFRAGRDEAARALVVEASATAAEPLRLSLDRLTRIHSGDAEGVIAEIASNGPSPALAEMQLATGRIDEALATARTLLAATPGEPRATRVLVLALLTLPSRDERALASARAAVEALPVAAPQGLREFLSGRLLLAQGDAAGAVAPLRTATAFLGDDPLVVLSLGEALFRSGDRGESLACLRRAAFMPGARSVARSILSDRLLDASRSSRRFDEALRLALESLKAAPDNVAAAVETVKLLYRRGEFRASAAAAERALASPGLPPEAAGVLRRQAIVARLSAGDVDGLATLVERLDAADRDGTFGLAVAGFAHLRAKRWDDAETALAAAQRLDPESRLAAIGRIGVAAGRSDGAAARAVLAEWRAAHPDDRDVELAAVSTLDAAGLRDVALDVARGSARDHPGEWRPSARLIALLGARGLGDEAAAEARRFADAAAPENRADAALLVGEVEMNHRGDAAAALRVARATANSPTITEETLARARLLESEALADLGRDADAEPIAAAVADTPAAARDPSMERRARFIMGVAALRSGRPGEAARIFSRCAAIDPGDRRALNNLALALGRSVDGRAKARTIAERLTSLDPLDANAWDTRGEIAAADGDVADAESSWRKALDLFAATPPRDADQRHAVAIRLAELLVRAGRIDDARSLARGVASGAKSAALVDRARRIVGR